VRTGRDEALDIFRKWESEGSVIRCQFSFTDHAGSVRGRIVLSVDCVRVLDGDISEFVLSLTEELEFHYGDTRSVPENRETYDSTLVVSFGPLPPIGPYDHASYAEIREGVKE
jgi:hypothetical protein